MDISQWHENDAATIVTVYGEVKIAGFVGLARLCEEVLLLREMKTGDRFPKGFRFGPGALLPEQQEPRHPSAELQRARAEVAALKAELKRLTRP